MIHGAINQPVERRKNPPMERRKNPPMERRKTPPMERGGETVMAQYILGDLRLCTSSRVLLPEDPGQNTLCALITERTLAGPQSLVNSRKKRTGS